MERRWYDAASLRRDLDGFERDHDQTSEEFMAAHVADDIEQLAEISGFDRHVWASTYAEWQRLSRSP